MKHSTVLKAAMVATLTLTANVVWGNDDLVNHGFDGTAIKGNIALQAEGCEVEFRKIA